jgi:acetylornithine deacetylase/succinyl-diaminopimelate desuccinylase-like protein
MLPENDLQHRLEEEIGLSLPRLIEMTQRLVRAPSPNPPGDTTAVVAVAEALLKAIPGMEVQRVAPDPRMVSLVARLSSGKPGRRLIFNGHLDTFPLGEDLNWTAPPLSGLHENGRIYGRGVCDMKGGIACSLLAADILSRHCDAWSGEIVITLAADEESMGELGTGYLLKHEPLAKGDANICGDVGSPHVVRFGEKGLYWIELEAEGKPAHGAHVHRGINAIDRLRGALDKLKQLEDIAVETPAAVRQAIEASKVVSERLSGVGESEVLQRVTVNIGTIQGGVSPNLIPSHAMAAADIRLPVGVTTAMIDARLQEWLAPMEGIRWSVTRRYEASFTPPDAEIIRCVVEAASRVMGEAPAVNMRVGASDSRWYRRYGVPTVVYGLTPNNMGGPDEYVPTEELLNVARVHTLAAFSYLSRTDSAATTTFST